MNVSLNAKMNKVYTDKMCGFLNVLHIYQKAFIYIKAF